VLITFAFRLFLVATVGQHSRFTDEDDYWSIAQSLVHGNGYSLFGHISAYRPPAMPYLLSLGMLVFGERYPVFAILDAALLCLVPFLVLWTALSFGLSRAYASVAAVLVAFHPGLNYAATTIYPTTITSLAVILSSLLTLKAMNRDSPLFGAIAGLCAGIAGCATTVFGPLGLILALTAIFKRHFRVGVCIAVLSLVPTLAWVVRNHRIMHTYSAATNGGFNMELGANDQATPRSGNLIVPEITPQESTGGELDWDKAHHDRAMAWIHAHPTRYAELFVLRSLAVLDSVGRPATRGIQDSAFARAIGWAMLPVILLGLTGLVLCRRHPLAWMTAGALLLVMASSGLTIVKPRFRFPCDPLLAIFAVAAVNRLTVRQKILRHVDD
jgi:hypothetical protein